ncbi:MAG: class I SAM-dependent methyltransferase [bacterium]
MTNEENIICPNCNSKKSMLLFDETVNIKDIFQKSDYNVTETGTGLFGNIYKCLDCDFRYINRTETENVLLDHYKNQPLDPNYLKGEKPRRKSFGKILERLEKIRKTNTGEILDIGCGVGFFLAEADRRGYKPFGIELSTKQVAYARDKFNLKNVEQGDITDFDKIFKDKKFDVITAFDVLEHIENFKVFFDKIHSHLKPNGIVIMTIPMIDSPGARLMGKKWHALLPSHINYFTKKSLENVYSSFGFTLEKEKWYTRYLYVSDLLGRILKNQNLPWLIFFDFAVAVNVFDEIEIYLRKKD